MGAGCPAVDSGSETPGTALQVSPPLGKSGPG